MLTTAADRMAKGAAEWRPGPYQTLAVDDDALVFARYTGALRSRCGSEPRQPHRQPAVRCADLPVAVTRWQAADGAAVVPDTIAIGPASWQTDLRRRCVRRCRFVEGVLPKMAGLALLGFHRPGIGRPGIGRWSLIWVMGDESGDGGVVASVWPGR